MPRLHEIAYPRFKTTVTEEELHEIYTPTAEELAFAAEQTRSLTARMGLLVLLKTFQRLGYFVPLATVPRRIVAHITVSAGLATIPEGVDTYDASHSRSRPLSLVRTRLGITAYGPTARRTMVIAAREATQTKEDLADIINVMLETLVHQRYELPAFSTLERIAFTVRDQDFLTETPFSDPLTLTTQPTDLVELTLAPQGGGLQRAIGSALLTLGGVFTSIVVIPADLADGIYIISAALAGSILATTGIRVVAAGATVPPTLEAIDPTTNLVVQTLVEGETLTLRGAGFRPGAIDITIDTAGGQALGTATSDPAGSFQAAFKWPVGIIGTRKVLAEQTAGGPTLDASANLFVQQIPR